MTYQRPIAVNIQITWGEFDEDGNMVGERASGIERIYHPFGHNLERRLLELEREVRKQGIAAKEGPPC